MRIDGGQDSTYEPRHRRGCSRIAKLIPPTNPGENCVLTALRERCPEVVRNQLEQILDLEAESVAHPLDRLASELIPVVAEQGAECIWSDTKGEKHYG